MDEFDIEILKELQTSGRASHSEIAARIGLSVPALAERVKKLEAAGYIRGYRALLDGRKLGKGITAFVSVQIDDTSAYALFEEAAAALPEVMECHHVVGEFDYLLKVKTEDTSSLEALISRRIRAIRGVGRSRTTIVLSTIREDSLVDLGRLRPTQERRRRKDE